MAFLFLACLSVSSLLTPLQLIALYIPFDSFFLILFKARYQAPVATLASRSDGRAASPGAGGSRLRQKAVGRAAAAAPGYPYTSGTWFAGAARRRGGSLC